MSDKTGGISQSVSGSVSGVTQQGTIGNSNQLTVGVQNSASNEEKSLTKEEAITLLAQLEEMVRVAALPKATKDDAMAYLNAARKAADNEDPKKEAAAINLKEMAETLQNASKTVDAGKSLWEKAQPVLVEVAKWLGTAAGILWTYLS